MPCHGGQTKRQTNLIVDPSGSSSVCALASRPLHIEVMRVEAHTHIYKHTGNKRNERVLSQTTSLPLCQIKYTLTEKPTTWAGTHAQCRRFGQCRRNTPSSTLAENLSQGFSRLRQQGMPRGDSFQTTRMRAVVPLQHCSYLPAKKAPRGGHAVMCEKCGTRFLVSLGFVLAKLTRAVRDPKLHPNLRTFGERERRVGFVLVGLPFLSPCLPLVLSLGASSFPLPARGRLLSMVGPPLMTLIVFLGGGDGGTFSLSLSFSRRDTQRYNPIHTAKASMDVPLFLLQERRYSTLTTGNNITCIRARGWGREGGLVAWVASVIRCSGVWGEGALRFVVWKESEDTFKKPIPAFSFLSFLFVHTVYTSQGYRMYVMMYMPGLLFREYTLCVSISLVTFLTLQTGRARLDDRCLGSGLSGFKRAR